MTTRLMVTTCLAAVCLAVAGCGGGGGGSGSNDNGVSFSFLGVFQEVQEQVAPAADTLPTIDNHPGDTGRIVDLSDLGAINAIPNDVNGDGDADGGFLGMENHLDFESINVEAVEVKIVIAGAAINPVAKDTVPMGIRLGPALVPADQIATNEAFAQTFFVRSPIIAFLNQNPSLLPQKPFTMNVVMKLRATSDSGDHFESNEFTYAVIVEPSAQ